MSPSATGLVLDRVTIAKAGTPLLSLSARIAPGAVHAVMGPSGSGKSTLLAYVAGFLRAPFSGEGGLALDGVDLAPLRPAERRMGLLFQDPLLFPHLSVGGNVRFAVPAAVRGRARAETVSRALREVGLEGCEARDPTTLSGGEQARVALARVLAARPCALLLDEPFSKLDMALRDQVRTLVFDTAAERGLPVLLVTHDPADAEAAGGAVTRLD
ncbi:ATP-binding cassette domain-containing protein [Reyranella sp.]|uniref:ATP-binding cassette domain-containing protein n=1 Tax=Reyranella sp. TaxID=1929291 RepID=UPI003BAA7A7B|tara:strand:- start:685 stop:1326 length:642 start_codon:yes stop_codon:yes gene_type:complete